MRSHAEATFVSVNATGVQLGRQQFSWPRSRYQEGPVLKEWRLNLVGLSHDYNLCCIAYSGQIFVYQPSFPTNELPSDPDLIITTPVSYTHLTLPTKRIV